MDELQKLLERAGIKNYSPSSSKGGNALRIIDALELAIKTLERPTKLSKQKIRRTLEKLKGAVDLQTRLLPAFSESKEIDEGWFDGKLSPQEQAVRIGLMGIRESSSLLRTLYENIQMDPAVMKIIHKQLVELSQYQELLETIRKTGKY